MADTIQFIMPSLRDTEALANALSPLLRGGDLLALEGDLGAGKSAFARALIRAYLNAPDTEVPSPTFTIVQCYQMDDSHEPKADIWHADLYRLSDPDELHELGLEDARDDSVMIVEWPERLDKTWREQALTLKFEILPAADEIEELPRAITLCVPTVWVDRLRTIKGNI